MGPEMFGFGATVATEREQGLLTVKRKLPAPSGSYLLAKLLMTMLFAFVVVATMIPAALLLGHLPLNVGAMRKRHGNQDGLEIRR
jgi:ABC-2 type transport system permease protein